jgi:hypothetical protein
MPDISPFFFLVLKFRVEGLGFRVWIFLLGFRVLEKNLVFLGEKIGMDTGTRDN